MHAFLPIYEYVAAASSAEVFLLLLLLTPPQWQKRTFIIVVEVPTDRMYRTYSFALATCPFHFITSFVQPVSVLERERESESHLNKTFSLQKVS